MSPSILLLLLHLGSLLQILKDVEVTIADAVSGKASKADVNAVLNDILALISSGVINIPGLTSDQLASAIANIQKSV